MFVTRNGAVSAKAGKLVIIPGTIGARSFIAFLGSQVSRLRGVPGYQRCHVKAGTLSFAPVASA